MMARDFDVAELDTHLERLLDLTLSERELILIEMERTEPDLAAVLRKVLRIAADAHSMELRAVGESLRLVSEDAPQPQIQGYRLLEEIGRGGMAAVYSAVRDVHGIEQTVAIKVMRAALLSPLERERFLNEQRILARLQHPNIATLLDVGIVDERPYMVLEHIDGETIDQRLKAVFDDLPAILDAIEKVSDALSLAHQHFVIHRDIKPGNVLIDRQGRIKLIDFGIAKILDSTGGLGADPTLTGNAPLTLRYASPEQLSGKPVGVASDVYQLGLLLYHLLTHAWPYDESDHEMPQERLRSEVLPVLASRRVTESRLKRALTGDIDSILLKCLRVAPAERYASVVEFREDLCRHREHRPVRARRQTRGYVLRSFMARHRLGVAMTLAVVLLVVVAVVSALGLAARSREYAGRTERLLDEVTEMFSSADPYAPSPKTTTVAEAVDRATDRFLKEQSSDPQFQARMLVNLAEMQRRSESHERMLALLQRAGELADAGGGDDPQLRSRIALGQIDALFQLGRYDEAIAALDQSAVRFIGADRVLAARIRGDVLSEQGHLDAAVQILSEVSADMSELPVLERADVLNSLAIVYSRQRNFAAELASYREAEALLDPALQKHQPALLRLRGNAASALASLGHPAEAADLFVALNTEVVAKLGRDHPMAAKVAANTAVMLQGVERWEDAWLATHDFDMALVLREEPIWRAQLLTIVAGSALYTGRAEQALSLIAEGTEVAVATLGSGSPRLAYYAEQLAWTLFEVDEVELALAAAKASYALSGGQRSVADLLLQLGPGLGFPVPGRPDPGFMARQGSDCDRTHFLLLERKMVQGLDPEPGVVPTDCAHTERARFEAMGLRVDPPRSFVGAEPMRSPLIRRWRGEQASPLVIDAEQRSRLRDLIQSLALPVAP